MQIGSLEFSSGLWPGLATVLLVVLFVRLGFWQLDRAELKLILLEESKAKQALNPVTDPKKITWDEVGLWRKVVIKGAFLDKPMFLLDNQINAGRAGYFVYSVFQAGEDTRVLVNRGWIKAMPRREELPRLSTPPKEMEISGTIKKPSFTGRRLAENTDEIMGEDIVRLQYLDISELNSKYAMRLRPFVVRLDDSSAAAYKLDWPLPATGREKHLGYAFQWFAMATAVLVIFIVLTLRRKDQNG